MEPTMWQATDSTLWTGRDDSRESPVAKRVFQTIVQPKHWRPEDSRDRIALLGFASDAGVARNMGRVGAASAPPVLRQALANLASHPTRFELVDAGDIAYAGDQLFARCFVHVW